MKRLLVGVLLLAGTMSYATIRPLAADSDVVGPLRAQYEATRNLVLGMANAIPEARYDYRPTPEVRSFREQLVHLINENHYYIGFAAGEPPGDPKQFDALKTRSEILNTLTASYDHGMKVLAEMTNEQAMETVSISPKAPTALRGQQRPRWTIILALMIDNMDHYGNLVVYARLNGIVPPRTAERQQPPRGN